jgi:hypothetical protein
VADVDVTTENEPATSAAACMAACAMPSTGTSSMALASARPGSPKRVSTYASGRSPGGRT